MSRTTRFALLAAGALLALMVLHVELNRGGFGRAVKRFGQEKAVRGELAVGFLPVT